VFIPECSKQYFNVSSFSFSIDDQNCTSFSDREALFTLCFPPPPPPPPPPSISYFFFHYFIFLLFSDLRFAQKQFLFHFNGHSNSWKTKCESHAVDLPLGVDAILSWWNSSKVDVHRPSSGIALCWKQAIRGGFSPHCCTVSRHSEHEIPRSCEKRDPGS